MVTNNGAEGNKSPHAAVDAKLRSVVEASPTVPSWYDAWTRLDTDSAEEDRLVVYQAIRQADSIPELASFWLVSFLIDNIATRDADDSIGHYESRMQSIKESHGFEEGSVWPSGAAPAGYDELRKEYYQAWNDHFARKLEAFGEHEMARLFRVAPDRFDQQSEEGRQYFHGPGNAVVEEPIIWLRRLLKTVTGCMTADSPMGPLGYRYGEEEGFWEVNVYPTPVELIGGAVDGEVVVPGFTLDAEELRTAFDRIEALGWHSLGFPHDEGPRFIVEGVYRGREVFLQVLAYAPDDEEPGMKLNTNVPEN